MEYVIKETKNGRIRIQLFRKGKPFGKAIYALNWEVAITTLRMLKGSH